MADLPKLSIITPSYNHASFLEQTIQSVVNQDYPNVEFIIIDGESTDNSVAIIKKYSDQISYWVSESDEDLRYALKKGFDKATGEIVAWQNADDFYEPNVFLEVMNVFRDHPQVNLVYGNVRLVDKAGTQISEIRLVPTNHWSTLYGGAFTMHSQALFFRRSLWDAMGGVTFDDLFYDFDLFIRASRLARMYFIHRILGNYRAHENSMFFGGKDSPTDAWITRRRYMGKWGRLPTWFFKPLALLSLARRTLWYARLGDWDYIFGGLKRRASKLLRA